MARIGISKTRSLFPSEEKLARFEGFALLFAEEPCPLSLQTVFSIPILAYYFFNYGILDANLINLNINFFY
jgi:hypothetical protein